MKTITEYRPLIFGEMKSLSEKRKAQRQRGKRVGAGVIFHSIAGLLLVLDTGLAPWNWQFWFIFTPLFVAAELIAYELSLRKAAILGFLSRRFQSEEIPVPIPNPANFTCSFPQMHLHRMTGTVIPARNACYTSYQNPIVATNR